MNFARKVFVGIATPLLLTVTACKPDVSTGGVESTTTTTVLPGSVLTPLLLEIRKLRTATTLQEDYLGLSV